jgi:mannose/cellobiose epimerase-like protein (N-acyl-D-glucosamine 2-epimerase family)
VRQELGACTDQHRRDWTPILSGGGALVSYGHDLETIWLLADAIETVGQSNAIWLDLYGHLFDYSYRHGLDDARGGFFYSGGFHRKAQDRRTVVGAGRGADEQPHPVPVDREITVRTGVRADPAVGHEAAN